jgi:hypothetical protein
VVLTTPVGGPLDLLGALFMVVLGATAAAAQAPEKEVIQVDDTRVLPLLGITSP